MESKSVYRAEPTWARQALVTLRAAGLHAELEDRRTEAVRQTGAYTPVDVVVPESEAASAKEVLERWTAESEKDAAPLGQSVGLALVTVFGPPVIAWMATSVLGLPKPSWLNAASIAWVLIGAAVVAIAQRGSASAASRE